MMAQQRVWTVGNQGRASCAGQCPHVQLVVRMMSPGTSAARAVEGLSSFQAPPLAFTNWMTLVGAPDMLSSLLSGEMLVMMVMLVIMMVVLVVEVMVMMVMVMMVTMLVVMVVVVMMILVVILIVVMIMMMVVVVLMVAVMIGTSL